MSVCTSHRLLQTHFFNHPASFTLSRSVKDRENGKYPQVLEKFYFGVFRTSGGTYPKILKMMDFHDFQSFRKLRNPGCTRKHQKRVKMSQKGTSRTHFGCFFIKYRTKRGRRPTAAALSWKRPKAASIFDEKAPKTIPEVVS